MPSTPRYAVQTYVKDKRGRISASRALACKNADEARGRAQRHCEGKSNVGAAAFLLHGDEHLGDTDPPEAIAIFGHVPPEVDDSIPF